MQGDSDFMSYFDDTMRAGHYENDAAAVECMVKSSPEIIDELISFGAEFARKKDGSLDLTREGGHSRNRICFHKDCTGREITSRLMQKVQTLKNVRIITDTTILDLICDGNGRRRFGVLEARRRGGQRGLYTNSPDHAVYR